MLASVGLTTGSEWPDEAEGRVGFGQARYFWDRIANAVKADLALARSTSPSFQVWVVAGLGDAAALGRSVTPVKKLQEALLNALVRGIAWGVTNSAGWDAVEPWIQAITNVWASAVDAGLSIDPQPACSTYDEWITVVRQLVDALNDKEPVDDVFSNESRRWSELRQFWRLEAYRIELVARGKIEWRDSTVTSKYRGIIE